MQFKYSPKVIIYPVLLILLIWLVFWFQVRVYSGIRNFGIQPASFEGLVGVLSSPFIHADIQHLYNNTIPLLVLSTCLFFFYPKIAWKVIVYGILISGLITWIIAKRGNHIGASGLIYVLFGFIFFKGLIARNYRLIALSFMVVFLYGSLVWYVFPIKEGMSWQGHLSGLLTGLVFALFFRKQIAKPERFIWEEETYDESNDAFMKHFDENGNFIERIEDSESEALLDTSQSTQPSAKINYIYKENKD